MILIVPHGVDPCAAFLSLGLPPRFVTHSDHYAVTLPEGVSEAEFQAALLVAPAGVYLAAAKAQATAAIRSNAVPAMMGAWPDVDGVVAARDALLAQVEAAETVEAVQAVPLTLD